MRGYFKGKYSKKYHKFHLINKLGFFYKLVIKLYVVKDFVMICSHIHMVYLIIFYSLTLFYPASSFSLPFHLLVVPFTFMTLFLCFGLLSPNFHKGETTCNTCLQGTHLLHSTWWTPISSSLQQMIISFFLMVK